MRRAKVYYKELLAGILEENAGGYRFFYLPEYLAQEEVFPVSLALPVREEPYESQSLFPFFWGLLAEGSLRELQLREFKIDPDDSFGLLLKTAAHDVIGCVRLVPDTETNGL